MSLRPPLALCTFCRLHDGGDGEGGGGDARLVHPGEPAAGLPHLLRDVRVHGGNRRLSSRVSYGSSPAGPRHARALPFSGPDYMRFRSHGKAECSDAAYCQGLAPTVRERAADLLSCHMEGLRSLKGKPGVVAFDLLSQNVRSA